MADKSYSSEAVEARRKYADAFNDTQLKIWADRIRRYNAIDKNGLIESLKAVPFRADPEYSELDFSLSFVYYGVYVNDGTGRETPVGNPSNIGRQKKRVRKPWFDPSFYRSFCRIKEFMADSFCLQFLGIVTTGLTGKDLRNSIR